MRTASRGKLMPSPQRKILDLTPPHPESAAEFFLEWPLYKSFVLRMQQGQNYEWDVPRILAFTGTMDAYCESCSQFSVFEIAKSEQYFFMGNVSSDETIHRRFQCSRSGCGQELLFVIQKTGTSVQKIGQLPSLADLASFELHKYRAALDPLSYADLNRAVGLAAHGIGNGSFVYLRRVFESLIKKARDVAASQAGWDEHGFRTARMDEKIEALKGTLPEFLVEHKVLYAILSIGVHELTEEQCLNSFEAVKLGIEMILDEEIERRRKADKIAEAKKSIHALASNIKGQVGQSSNAGASPAPRPPSRHPS